ncbi:hypothetical protein RRG08_057359 [Elysia crispata]|uniref:Uncharacterized protein n=1 Tax=Elysia crispata TaxID=231223 RepID=A0AAE0YJ49_9GAST|nr:hypothetical protein RRG08_057359 [Elysia crispata]
MKSPEGKRPGIVKPSRSEERPPLRGERIPSPLRGDAKGFAPDLEGVSLGIAPYREIVKIFRTKIDPPAGGCVRLCEGVPRLMVAPLQEGRDWGIGKALPRSGKDPPKGGMPRGPPSNLWREASK